MLELLGVGMEGGVAKEDVSPPIADLLCIHAGLKVRAKPKANAHSMAIELRACLRGSLSSPLRSATEQRQMRRR